MIRAFEGSDVSFMTLGQLLHVTTSAWDTVYLAGLRRPQWNILKKASPPFPFASGGLQRPLLNFKGCLLKSLEVCAGPKRLLSLCKSVQGDVPGGAGLWCSVMGTKMASFVQKLHKPVLLSYMHAASKTSALMTSKGENQSTRILLALAEPYLSVPFPPVLMLCSHGEPR